jgi:hypothetical protein
MWTEETRMWDLALAVATGGAATPDGLIDLATLIAETESSPQAEAAGEPGLIH